MTLVYGFSFFFFVLCFFIRFFGILWVFLTVLGLRCCMPAFSSCGEWGLLFIVVLGLLIAVASPAAEHRLWAHGLQQLWLSRCEDFSSCGSQALQHRLSSCGARAQLLHGMGDLPRTWGQTHVPCTGRRILLFFNKCSIILFIYLFIYFGCTTWHVGSQFPNQGSNPRPLQWERRVLTAGPPGKSLAGRFLTTAPGKSPLSRLYINLILAI